MLPHNNERNLTKEIGHATSQVTYVDYVVIINSFLCNFDCSTQVLYYYVCSLI